MNQIKVIRLDKLLQSTEIFPAFPTEFQLAVLDGLVENAQPTKIAPIPFSELNILLDKFIEDNPNAGKYFSFIQGFRAAEKVHLITEDTQQMKDIPTSFLNDLLDKR